MKKPAIRLANVLKELHNYILFFIIVAFVVTCCMLLFLSAMTKSMNIELTTENINLAARLTMINVFLLSLILTVADVIRRRIVVRRPAQRIIDAGEKLTQGDFSVRIPCKKHMNHDDPFNSIAQCFNKMAEEMASTETLRTDFIANVSHELKTPLAAIKNYGTLLQADDLTEEKRMEYAKAITESSGRLARLITNILKLNKLENQQIMPIATEYDLSEQICQCLLAFEDVWEKKNINIDTQIDDNVIISSDEEMMSLVWNNLFSNAFKFTPEGGTVTVSLTANESSATVTVADTGCGISQEVGKHMFDKFYQGDTSHATQGNGLGLALVKRVVDLTGCSISVSSEVDKGTTFSVTVRRAQ